MALPQHRFGPTAEELEYLTRTKATSWDAIWVQGGQISAKCRCAEGQYTIGQLTFVGESRLWVGADIVDTGWEDEVWFIAVGNDPRFGELEHERRFRPRRKAIEQYPKDLDLRPFLVAGRDYEVLSWIRDATVDGAYDRTLVDEALIITSATGERLLLSTDREQPLEMLVTCCDSEIERAIAQSTFVRSSFEQV